MQFCHLHTAVALLRSWITFLHLDQILGPHSSYQDFAPGSQSFQIAHFPQVNGALLTLLGGSLNPQGVLEVLLYDFDNRAGLHLNTRLGLTGQ